MSSAELKLKRAEELWIEFGPLIHRTLLSYEADPQLREDLSQNVFLALVSAMPRIDSVLNLKAYISRIAHNVATTHVAKESRRKWVGLEEAPEDDSEDPSDAVGSQSDFDRLVRAIRRLKLPYRQVMVLLLEDFSDQEIAEIIGISHGNVRVRINRAKSQLKELMHHD